MIKKVLTFFHSLPNFYASVVSVEKSVCETVVCDGEDADFKGSFGTIHEAIFSLKNCYMKKLGF